MKLAVFTAFAYLAASASAIQIQSADSPNMYETIFGQTDSSSRTHSHSHSHSFDEPAKKKKSGGHSSTSDYNYGWFDEEDPAGDIDDFDNMSLKKAIGDHISNKGFGNTRG